MTPEQSVAARTNTASFSPATQVVDELNSSPLPREAKAAMAALSVETLLPTPGTGVLAWPYAWSPFLCLFGFTEYTGSTATFPDWAGVTINGVTTHAAGVWQDEPATDAEISQATGRPGFEPQDQIAKNYYLAVRDFGTRDGGDFLAALQSGTDADLARISPGLSATWPEGADPNFPTRYKAALALFPAETNPAPAPPTVTQPLPGAALPAIPLGERCTVPILSATDKNGQAVQNIPADLLRPDDPSICSAAITGMTLSIDGLALGSTTLRGADQAVPVSVVVPAVAHLSLDFAHAALSPIAAAIKSAVARMPLLAVLMAAGLGLMTGPAQTPTADVVSFAPIAAVAPVAPRRAPSLSDQPTFGMLSFCLQADQSAVAIERCLRWTGALRR